MKVNSKIVTLEDLNKIASKIVQTYNKTNKILVIGLIGDLGSGKTTLVKEIAKQLNVNQPIISPTFIIDREYKLKNNNIMHHIDLYRLETETELNEIITEGLIQNHNLILIEWYDRFSSYLDKLFDRNDVKLLKVYFEHYGEFERVIKIVYENTIIKHKPNDNSNQ